MGGVHNDDGHDDASAYSFPHCRDTHPDFPKAFELYCGDLFDCRRHCRSPSLMRVDCLSKVGGRGRERRRTAVVISYRRKEAHREITRHSSAPAFTNRRRTDSHRARIIEPDCCSVPDRCGPLRPDASLNPLFSV